LPVVHHPWSVVRSVARGEDAQLMFETEKQGMRASLYQLTKTPPLGFDQLIGDG
jgi:hypothetical protein